MLKNIDEFLQKLISSLSHKYTLSDQIGLCLLFAYKAKQNNSSIDNEHFEFFLNNILNIKKYSSNSITDGTSGVLWLLRFLKKQELLDFSDKEIFNLINLSKTKYKEALAINNWGYYYNGAIGHLVALDDLNYYNSFLDFIYSKLETCNDNSKKLLSLNYNKDTNLGLHAGILGILAVTNKLLKKNRLKEKATLIQNEILDMIINKLEESDFKYYPALYKENKPCRLCWTYGELILALQLLAAGKLTANENVERYATDLAEVASTRTTLDEAMVYDSCIISGTVRNYLLYKLFNKYSHSKKIENLEFLWRDYTHIILFENKYHNINRYTLKPQIDLSILSGLSGIYISMSDFDYLWSEYILLDIF